MSEVLRDRAKTPLLQGFSFILCQTKRYLTDGKLRERQVDLNVLPSRSPKFETSLKLGFLPKKVIQTLLRTFE